MRLTVGIVSLPTKNVQKDINQTISGAIYILPEPFLSVEKNKTISSMYTT